MRYSLPEDNATILTSAYQLYLPTEEQLLTELKRELRAAEPHSTGDSDADESGPIEGS